MVDFSTLTDAELTDFVKLGNQLAYIEIYDRYKKPLQQHAYKKLGNMDEVEDILQELFIYLWDKRDTLILTSSLSGYLFTAVRNRIFNLYYKKQLETIYLDSLQDFIDREEPATDLITREKECSSIIEKEISALPPRMKEVFLLSRKEGLTHKQIAERLGTSEQTVSTQIRNSLKILRVRLGTLFACSLFL
jgi:RNA polymerase sigma-70 factor (ECF subfamily)